MDKTEAHRLIYESTLKDLKDTFEHFRYGLDHDMFHGPVCKYAETAIFAIVKYIQSNTDLCDTFSCYEDCERCVEKYLNESDKKDTCKKIERFVPWSDVTLTDKINEIIDYLNARR